MRATLEASNRATDEKRRVETLALYNLLMVPFMSNFELAEEIPLLYECILSSIEYWKIGNYMPSTQQYADEAFKSTVWERAMQLTRIYYKPHLRTYAVFSRKLHEYKGTQQSVLNISEEEAQQEAKYCNNICIYQKP